MSTTATAVTRLVAIVPKKSHAAEFPIGCSLAVVVRAVGGQLIAVRIERILERPSR
jgi:hypothetical protein